MRHYYIYILASYKNGTLYIGVTNNLIKRIYQHKKQSTPGFTQKYNINKLIYFEEYQDIDLAIKREKQLKKWARQRKIDLIEKNNPAWIDLFEKIIT